ncbi:MAG: hypothetical protein GY820_24245, partial [Gammaproteobacteria bacterium]|nr:hypothetical protein [Gammaproteobacteria bacterium]
MDYLYSNPPNENCCKNALGTGRESQANELAVIDSLPVPIKPLRELLEENFAKSNSKMEKLVTDVRELSEVVDHDIMKRDQESDRFNRQLLESEKTTDRFKNETPILSEFNRSLLEAKKTTDRFKKEVPITTCYESLDPRNPWGDAYFESGAPKPGSIAELDQAIKRRLREEANS